jgi:hypothetical protein
MIDATRADLPASQTRTQAARRFLPLRAPRLIPCAGSGSRFPARRPCSSFSSSSSSFLPVVRHRLAPIPKERQCRPTRSRIRSAVRSFWELFWDSREVNRRRRYRRRKGPDCTTAEGCESWVSLKLRVFFGNWPSPGRRDA